MTRQWILGAVVALATVACTKAPVDNEPGGADLLAPFKAELKAALMQGMRAGPVEAIAICRDKAPDIAAALSVDGVTMGRSSHRLRNAANAPQAWLAPIIEGYANGSHDLVARSVDIGSGRRGYVEPIVVQPLCLACHGRDVPPAVAARLDDLYPEDRATGFAEGDFRGVFWVEF